MDSLATAKVTVLGVSPMVREDQSQYGELITTSSIQVTDSAEYGKLEAGKEYTVTFTPVG